MTRRALVVGLAAAVLLAACEDAAPPKPTAAQEPAPAAAPQEPKPAPPPAAAPQEPATPPAPSAPPAPSTPTPPPGTPSTQGPMKFPATSMAYSGKVGDRFSQQLPAATGGKEPVKYTLIGIGIIGGLRFDESTRTLAGTPTSHGSERMLLLAVDAGEGVYQRAAQMWVRVSIETNLPKTITVTATLRYSSIERVTLSELPGYKATYRVAWKYNPPGDSSRLGLQSMSVWYPIQLHATAPGCRLQYRVYVRWESASASVSMPCAEVIPPPPCRRLPCDFNIPTRYRYFLRESQAEARFKTLDGRTKTWTCRLSAGYLPSYTCR